MSEKSAIKVYNTATRRLEEFVPREPGRVGMYVCGPTVYDDCHVGHARAMVAFDVIMRSSRHKSGFALRFPRIVALRRDKPATEIDTLATVERLHRDLQLGAEHLVTAGAKAANPAG